MRMPDEQEQAIIPVEQDTVPFYNRQIIAARLPDGRIAVSLRNMCSATDRPLVIDQQHASAGRAPRWCEGRVCAVPGHERLPTQTTIRQ
jgi:hypothetical protein